MNLSGFIDTFKDAIAKRVVESYPPLYRPSETPVTGCPGCCAPRWAGRRTPSRARPSPSRPIRGTTVVGEMGTGKTFSAPRHAA